MVDYFLGWGWVRIRYCHIVVVGASCTAEVLFFQSDARHAEHDQDGSADPQGVWPQAQE